MKNIKFQNILRLYSTRSKVVDDAINFFGINPNKRAWGYEFPLHHAAGLGRYKIVEVLIKNGADINILGIMGLTPLHYAIINGKYKIVELLIKNNADVNISNDEGETTLTIAKNRCDVNKNKIISLLLKNGAK